MISRTAVLMHSAFIEYQHISPLPFLDGVTLQQHCTHQHKYAIRCTTMISVCSSKRLLENHDDDQPANATSCARLEQSGRRSWVPTQDAVRKN